MRNTTNPASNLTQGATSKHGMEEMAKLLPIAVAITLTNGLVFFMFYKRKSLHNSSNYLLLGLAVCDFLTGTVSIPFYLIFFFDVVPSNSTMRKDFAHSVYTLHTLMAVSAAYHILVITTEKYLAITQPLRHHLVTKKTVFKVLAGIWVLSGFIAVIPFAWRETQSQFLWYIVHSATCLVIVFLVPYVFTVYAYTVMFKAVRARKKPWRNKDTVRIQRNYNTDQKCLLVFAIMAATYLCCWLPYFTLMLMISMKRQYNKTTEMGTVIERASDAFLIIRFITSVTNPLLYTFFKRDFWLALRSLSLKKKYSFAVRRTSTLRSFSLAYSAKIRSRSTDSTRSNEVGSPCIELEDNVQMYEEHIIVYISSV